MADTKKKPDPSVEPAEPVAPEPAATEPAPAPTPPVAAPTPPVAAPAAPAVTVTRGENGTVTNEIGGRT